MFAEGAPKQKSLYVATTGNDANPCTKARHFATLERARDELRRIKQTGLPPGGVTVEIADGIYGMKHPIEFTAEDSGTESAPITYRGGKRTSARTPTAQAHFVGGRMVTGWQPVTDPSVLERMAASAHGKVYQANLNALGITDLQGINNARTYQSDPGLEVFFNDKPMTLARYPNEGYMHIKNALDAEGKPMPASKILTTPPSRFICDDPRPARWTKENDIWLHGFWVYDWADSRVPLGKVDVASNMITLGSGNAAYGIRTGQWFYAENVLPELDSAGEWYLDRETSILYFGSSRIMVQRVRIRTKDPNG